MGIGQRLSEVPSDLGIELLFCDRSHRKLHLVPRLVDQPERGTPPAFVTNGLGAAALARTKPGATLGPPAGALHDCATLTPIQVEINIAPLCCSAAS